jgi:hypothetical protein
VVEVPPERAETVKDWRLARLERFAKAFKGPAGGNKEEALRLAGDEWGNPVVIAKKNLRQYQAENLYRKAVQKGLIVPDKKYIKEERVPKDQLLSLLAKQALGEKPTKRYEVLRRNDDNGAMEVIEIRQEFDEQDAQDKLARILGLYKEPPREEKPLDIAAVLATLKGGEKRFAEEALVEAQMKLLEGTVLPVETIEKPDN